MSGKRIGIDVDGVLAAFNESFIPLMANFTGRNLFPENFVPTTWNYPQTVGYTDKEVAAVWDWIVQSPDFWMNLGALPNFEVFAKWMSTLNPWTYELYFITARPGLAAKWQTEEWFYERLGMTPTVIISSEKGMVARALRLDFYVDDRLENTADVTVLSPTTQVFLLDQPWNQHERPHGQRIERLGQMFAAIDPLRTTQRA